MTQANSSVRRMILGVAVVLAALALATSGVATPDTEVDDLEIGAELTDATGETEVIVRLEEIPAADLDDDDPDDALADHAEQTQQPLLEYADETDGVTVEETFWLSNTVLLEVDTDRVALETFEQFEAVEELHANFEVEPPEPPTEPETADDLEPVTPGLELLNVPAAWDSYDTRGEGARVVVLDTGIDADHPDLELYSDDPTDATMPGGWAEFDDVGEQVDGSTPYDSGTHGTHVSGTVAGGNASGTAIGVAPEADLAHGLVLTEEGGTFAQLLAGMEWAVDTEADVINFSLGSQGRIDELIDPVAHAIESDAVVVAAIGNQGHGTSGAPGNIYDSISVGAVNAEGTVAPFSGGESIDRSEWESPPDEWPEQYTVPTVAAHGVAVPSTVPGGYAELPGTSMATPHVTGTVGLMRSAEPDATPEEIRRALIESAWKPDSEPAEQDDRYGYGIIDTDAALEELHEIRANESVQPASEQEVDADGPASVRPIGFVLAVVGLLLAVAAFVDRTN